MIADAALGGESFLGELLDDLGDVELGMRLHECDVLTRANERGRVEVDEPSPRVLAFMFRSLRRSFVIQLSFFDSRLGRVLLLPGPGPVGQLEAEIVIRLVGGQVPAPSMLDGIVGWVVEGQFEARLPQLPSGRCFLNIQSCDWQRLVVGHSSRPTVWSSNDTST